MNAVIYARFSDAGQREESIEGQLTACYAFAKEQNYTIIKEYIDRAQSARTDQRPQFQQMMQDAKKKNFDFVIVYQLDRFARDRFDSAFNKKTLKSYGIKVLSATENISDSPEGQMLEGILESFAEYQSADMSRKIRRGHNVNAEKCVYNGGPVPIGYIIDEKKHYQIDPEKAAVVKKVFEEYANSKPIVEIVEDLKVNKIKTCRNTDFTVNSFRTMLQNKRYTGCYIYSDIEIPDGIPRIIDDDLFYRVQEKIKRNKKAPSSRERYILTTKLFCGECKGAMVGRSGTSHTGKVHSYYSCTNHRNKVCDKKDFPKEHLEDIVVDECRKRLTDKSIHMIAKEVSTLCEKEYNTPIIKHLKSELAKCRTAIENLTKAIETGQEFELLLSRISARRNEEKEIEQQLRLEEGSKLLLSESEITAFLMRLKNGDINDFKYRQGLVNILVNSIYLYSDKVVIIFNTGNRPVEIDLKTFSEIEKNLISSHKKNEGVPNKPCNICYKVFSFSSNLEALKY